MDDILEASDSELDDTVVNYEMEKSEISLNYSKEDVAALVDEAEKLVMEHSKTILSETGGDYDTTSSDSDYETKVSRDWLVQSEPNICLRRLSPTNQRRRRKSVTKTRRDWRHSLPECLEYFKHSNSDTDDNSDDGRESQVSLPLSDLWEHDHITEEHGQDDHDKAVVPPDNLESFGDDYSAFLYSDIETESELFTEDDLEDDSKHAQHNISYKILQSKSTLKSLLIQINNDSSDKNLEQIQEVCEKNILLLSDQIQKLENRQQIKCLKRLIGKWEHFEIQIRAEMQQRDELETVMNNINMVTGDLETLDTIILDDDETDELDEDSELTDIRQQLLEQSKSHLLEISDTLFKLNISLHDIRSKYSSVRGSSTSEVEEKLRSVYTRWQVTHHNLAQAEDRHQRHLYQQQQGEFDEVLTEKLSRLARTEEYVNNSDVTKVNDDDDENDMPGPGWWRNVVKYSMVSGLVLVSMMTASYTWSYNKCQHGYYSTVWPLITFTSAGPRPY